MQALHVSGQHDVVMTTTTQVLLNGYGSHQYPISTTEYSNSSTSTITLRATSWNVKLVLQGCAPQFSLKSGYSTLV